MKAKTKKRYYYSTYGYDNALDYIAADGKIPLIKKDNFDRYSLDNMIEWWKKKAQNRYEKLKEEDRLRHEMEIYTLEKIEAGNVDMVR